MRWGNQKNVAEFKAMTRRRLKKGVSKRTNGHGITISDGDKGWSRERGVERERLL
jgi:hypothetical protein